jgi:peptidoglycan-associated lipoprotein
MNKQLNLFIMITLTAFLAVGCAKKATETPAETAAPAPVAQPAAPVQESMPMTETEVKDTSSAAVADLVRIHFDFDSYVLSADARTTLQQNAAILKAGMGLKVRVEGHCDERGSDDYNLALGERRAQSAVDYLVTLGVPASQLSTISYGEMQPLDPGHSEAAWSKNRRAEFVAQ